ncbi:hypothetical protein M2S00_06620 [Apilactobacillus sp. TMW 2.2459]|uniref:hypothetical protein n=1 Tax=Apilactobacillus xinyiensis TaxID=2841032 RepID=UPI00200F882A|nr:hypothetical protein [Apilactobacillus xinyiensis]MCL0312777.1 hypothetical protein [Apilactobacillus xinyiensis]
MLYTLETNDVPDDKGYLETRSMQIGDDIYNYWVRVNYENKEETVVSDGYPLLMALDKSNKDNDNLKQMFLNSQKTSMQSNMQLKQLQQNYMLSQQQLMQANEQNKNMQQMILQLQKQLMQKGDK